MDCELCGEPMPEGETMFRFHGYSGACPKPPLPRAAMPDDLPPVMQMLSELQSGTMDVCRADTVLAYGDARAAKERDLRMAVCAQAYQVVGSLLSDLGQFDTDHATKILDNLNAGAVVHDVLPWPSFAQSNKDEPPSNEFYRIALNNISIRKTSNEQS